MSLPTTSWRCWTGGSRRTAGTRRSTPPAPRRNRRIATRTARLTPGGENMNAILRIAFFALATATGVAQAQMPTMEAVIGNNFGHLPMFVGVEKGLFKKHGIDVKLRVVNTGTDMVNAMQKNEVQ